MAPRRIAMIGLALVGVIAGAGALVFASVAGQVQPHGMHTTRARMRAIENGVVAFQTDNTDACPVTLDLLYTQRYLTHEPRDEWGEPFVLTCPGVHDKEGVDLVSKGADGHLGTPDDIKSWEP